VNYSRPELTVLGWDSWCAGYPVQERRKSLPQWVSRVSLRFVGIRQSSFDTSLAQPQRSSIGLFPGVDLGGVSPWI